MTNAEYEDTKTDVIVSDTLSYLGPNIIAMAETCDIAIHAGDKRNREVLDLLHEATGQVIAVLGNNDSKYLWASHEVHAIEALPKVGEFESFRF